MEYACTTIREYSIESIYLNLLFYSSAFKTKETVPSLVPLTMRLIKGSSENCHIDPQNESNLLHYIDFNSFLVSPNCLTPRVPTCLVIKGIEKLSVVAAYFSPLVVSPRPLAIA